MRSPSRENNKTRALSQWEIFKAMATTRDSASQCISDADYLLAADRTASASILVHHATGELGKFPVLFRGILENCYRRRNPMAELLDGTRRADYRARENLAFWSS